MNYYSDSSEWKYLFQNAIDWDAILPLYGRDSFPTSDGFQGKQDLLAFYEDLLTAIGKWSGEVLSMRAGELDQVGGGKLVDEEVHISDPLQKTYKEAVEMDFHGMTMNSRYGGMGAPVSVGLIAFVQICRACISTSGQLAFFGNIADMIERFCDREIQDQWISRIRKGEISGSMCLTEPDSGSDVGALRTTAEKQADGTYLLNGSKCFITNGGGGLAFILARVRGAPSGLDGISLFIAQEWIELSGKSGEITKRHNYRVSKIEEKMGMHGSITCEVVYENTVANLVGRENEGFKLMLYLMNEARISVGLQGLGGIEACLSAVRRYAESRKQFGDLLVELPLYKRNLLAWETEQDAIRVLMVDTISYFDIFQKLDMKKRYSCDLNRQESQLFAKASRVVRRRTPLVKYYGSEAYASISQKAVQAFGGYGYMQEYSVERFHRDSFGSLLYEGTSQIQALMVMKDFIKGMMKNPAEFIKLLAADHPFVVLITGSCFDRSVANLSFEFRKNVAILIMRCFNLSQINCMFKREYWKKSNRFEKLMVHAETFCQAMAYLEVLKILAQHATRNASRGELFYCYKKLVTPRLAGIYADWRV